MYQKFTVLDIRVVTNSKQITIEFSNDINDTTIDGRSIYLYRKSNGDSVALSYIVDGNTVIANIVGDILFNEEYEIIVNTNVLNIYDSCLELVTRETVIFSSIITNTVNIVSPVKDEVLDKCLIKWEEIASENNSLFNSYEVEVSTDIGFKKLLSSVHIKDKNEVILKIAHKSLQYFARVRVVGDDNTYGNWSNHVVFELDDNYFAKSNDSDDDEPLFEQDYEIISLPEQGMTCDRFIIEFECDIDPDSVEDNIIVTKSRI
jgi:hypothetical protein